MGNLSLKNINKIYPNGVQAVFDFNIEIKDGEFIVLVGPSGCGKSTLLRMIAGLEAISSGEFLMDGKRVNELAPSERDLAMIFQDYALYSHMTVYENMAFSNTVQRVKTDVIHDRVMEASEIVDLNVQLNRLPKNLSGGQRQRVALGRSIVKKSNLLLMDEPLSNLDARLRNQTRREIKKLHNQLQSTIIYVTHDQIEAMTMADRIVVMSHGHVQQIGTPMEIYQNPVNKYVAGFIGTPPMNFIEGTIVDNHFVNADFKVKLSEEHIKLLKDYNNTNKGVIFGVRPEVIHVGEEAENLNVKFVANVDYCELLGAEILVKFFVAGTQVIANINSKYDITNGQKVEMAIDMKKVHFFDKETELTLK